MAVFKVSPRRRNFLSVSNIRSLTNPIMQAFSTDECASFEQYAISFDKRTPSSTNGYLFRNSLIISNLAASNETKIHSLAEP